MTYDLLRTTGLSRRSVLAGGLASAAAVLLPAAALADDQACCPTRKATLLEAPAAVPLSATTAGNQRAMDLARKSARIMDANDAVLAMADGLADATVRSRTLDVLRNPAPTYQLKSPSRADKEMVRQE